MMKLFALFAGDRLYPLGGWRDFRGSFHEKNNAIIEGQRNSVWAQVVDTSTWEMVCYGYRTAGMTAWVWKDGAP